MGVGGEDQKPERALVPPQISFPWAEQQLKGAPLVVDPFALLQSMASQSPDTEITLDLVAISPKDAV